VQAQAAGQPAPAQTAGSAPTSAAPTTTATAPVAATAPQTASQSQSQSQSHTGSQQQQPQQHASSASPAPAPTPTVTAGQTPAPIQATQTAQAPTEVSTRPGVSMQDAVDNIRTTIENAGQGVTQARIELSPASLGTIRIQIQRTENGVTAHVVADHASTADTLSQGGDDLKRQLANAGVTLLSLNIETRGGGSGQPQNSDSGSASGSNSNADQIDAVGDDGAVEPTTSALSGSALVNVLA
jgi:flagellar hook-length control protein FliK